MESNIDPIKFDCEVCDENFQQLSSVVGDIIDQKFNRGIKERGNGKWSLNTSSATCLSNAQIKIKATKTGYAIEIDCEHSFTGAFWVYTILLGCFGFIPAFIPFYFFNERKSSIDKKLRTCLDEIEDSFGK